MSEQARPHRVTPPGTRPQPMRVATKRKRLWYEAERVARGKLRKQKREALRLQSLTLAAALVK